jgi:hypothetical protein
VTAAAEGILRSDTPAAQKLLGLVSRVALPVSLLSLALFLRVYNFELLTWIPDSYERLSDAQRIAAGELPQSKMYGPGAALVFAPAFLVFPPTLTTMHGVLIASGVALVAMGYLLMLRATGDRLAAALFAGLIATGPLFVFASRDNHPDAAAMLIAAGLLIAAPSLRAKPLWLFVLYGLIAAVYVSIRPSSVFLLPALFLYWQPADQLRPRALLQALRTPAVLFAGGSFAICSIALLLAGDSAQSPTEAAITLERFTENVLFYELHLVFGPLGILFMVPFAVLGASRLSRDNRPLLLAGAWIIIVWPIVHAPFYFHTDRYMLPPLFFIYMLFALGASSALTRLRLMRGLPRYLTASYLLTAFAVLGIMFSLVASTFLSNWKTYSNESDEGQGRESRPVIASLATKSLIVSSVSRAIKDANHQVDYLDLIDYSLESGFGPDATAALNCLVARAVDEGRRVYYFYSHLESPSSKADNPSRHYDRYWRAVQSQFVTEEVFHTSAVRTDLSNWVLYEIRADPGAALVGSRSCDSQKTTVAGEGLP